MTQQQAQNILENGTMTLSQLVEGEYISATLALTMLPLQGYSAEWTQIEHDCIMFAATDTEA